MQQDAAITAAQPEAVQQRESEERSNLLAILGACGGNIIWGFSFLFTRIALQTAAPEIVLSLRFLTAFLFMNLLLLTGRGKVSFKGKRFKPLLILAVLEPLYFYFESYGILYTNATTAGVMLAAVPVLSLLVAALFLKEYPTKRRTIACFFPIIGVMIITISGSALGVISPLGVLLLICTCLTSAVQKTLNRKAAQEYSPFERTYASLLASSVIFGLAALRTVDGNLGEYAGIVLRPQVILPVLALSIFCSVVANMLVNYAAGRMEVVKLSTFGAVSTICSTFAGVLFLGEPVTVASLIGSLLIIFGIWLVTRP